VSETADTIAPVKALHTSDWHVGRTIRGRSRAEEHRSVLSEITRHAAHHAVDVVLVAGDLFDVATPTPESESIVYRAVLDLAEVAPVVAVSGNHDNPRRFDAIRPLLDLGRVTVVSSIARPQDGGVLELDDIGVRLVPIPWTSQRAIVTAADLFDKDRDDTATQYIDRMRRVVAALTADAATDVVNVVVGHVMMHADPSGSERLAHTIYDYSLPAQIFPGHLTYVALGHLHRPQRVPAPVPVRYSGSPMQLDFGEAGEAKSVVLVEAGPGAPASIDLLEITSGTPLVQLRGTLEQVLASADGLGEAHVKVVLDEAPRVGLADEVRSRIPGVVDVGIERSVDEPARRRVRSRLGRRPSELFAEYLEGSGGDPALVAVFDELYDEVT